MREQIFEEAPDGSTVQLLFRGSGGSVCHVSLPPLKTSRTIKHLSVSEFWYFLQGTGVVWQRTGENENELSVYPGVSLAILAGTHFQFRNIGDDTLCFLCFTLPTWPGPEEAVIVDDHWVIK